MPYPFSFSAVLFGDLSYLPVINIVNPVKLLYFFRIIRAGYRVHMGCVRQICRKSNIVAVFCNQVKYAVSAYTNVIKIRESGFLFKLKFAVFAEISGIGHTKARTVSLEKVNLFYTARICDGTRYGKS